MVNCKDSYVFRPISIRLLLLSIFIIGGVCTTPNISNKLWQVHARQEKDQLPPSVQIISPDPHNPDQVVFANDGKASNDASKNQPIKIEWLAVDNVGVVSFDIVATTQPLNGNDNSPFPLNIASGLAGDKRSFDWTPGPNVISETVHLKIIARDAAGNIGTDLNRLPVAIRNRPIIKFIEYFCGEVRLYGDGFTSASTVILNGNRPQLPGGINPQPLPKPTPEKGSQLFIIYQKAKSTVGPNPNGKFVNVAGAKNPIVITTDGLFSAEFVAVSKGPKPPRVQITSPARDATFKPGDVVFITWTASEKCPIRSQQILFAIGNRGFDGECDNPPVRRDILVANLKGTQRSFKWKIPEIGEKFGRLKVTSSSTEGPGFDIVGTGNPNNAVPQVNVTGPRPGTDFASGDTININWKYSGTCDPVAFDIDFEISKDNAIIVAKGLSPDTSTYSWTTPKTLKADGGTIIVKARGITSGKVGNIFIGQSSPGSSSVRINTPRGPVNLVINDPDRGSLDIKYISNDSKNRVVRYEIGFIKDTGERVFIDQKLPIIPGSDFFNEEQTSKWVPQFTDFPDSETKGTIRVQGFDKDNVEVGADDVAGIVVKNPAQ